MSSQNLNLNLNLNLNPNSEAAILARVIQRDHKLSPEAAQYLLSLRFGEHDIDRMNELSELAQQGKLNPTEQAELDSYICYPGLPAWATLFRPRG